MYMYMCAWRMSICINASIYPFYLSIYRSISIYFFIVYFSILLSVYMDIIIYIYNDYMYIYMVKRFCVFFALSCQVATHTHIYIHIHIDCV